jgi:catechol 2,3-dioxygenase-like lactoylglutathione lyase family enzyme
MLDVPDLPASIAFWTDAMGFEVVARMDDEKGRPFWAQVQRDDIRVMFSSHYHDEEEADHGAHDAELTGAIYINVDDVDAISTELEGRVTVVYGPADQPHGMRELAIRDNSGYVVIFGKPL